MLLSLCLFFHDKVSLMSEVKLLLVTAGDADSQASHDDRRWKYFPILRRGPHLPLWQEAFGWITWSLLEAQSCIKTTMTHIARIWQEPIYFFPKLSHEPLTLSTSQLSNLCLNSLDAFLFHQALWPKPYSGDHVLISGILPPRCSTPG